MLGFLGRNGAGKSTTMNMITGYISASEGQITLDGMDVLEQPREVKRRIGYLPEQPPLYMDMTVEEYLKFVCDIKEVRKKSQKAHLDDLYNLVKITDVRHRLIKNLSKGYKAARGPCPGAWWATRTWSSWTSPRWVWTPSRSSRSAS